MPYSTLPYPVSLHQLRTHLGVCRVLLLGLRSSRPAGEGRLGRLGRPPAPRRARAALAHAPLQRQRFRRQALLQRETALEQLHMRKCWSCAKARCGHDLVRATYMQTP